MAEKRSTNRKAGTASRGWGRLEKMLQPAAARTVAPRGMRTRLIARPSGTFCTAIATAIRMPNALPSANAAPTPIPSAAEWAVITTTISSACLAASPLSEPRVNASCAPSSR